MTLLLTTTGNTNGLLGAGPAFATSAGGVTWAKNAGGGVGGLLLSDYSTNFAPNANTDLAGGITQLQSNTTTNSLRLYDSGGYELDLLGANLTLQSGGILMSPTTGSTLIDGAFTGTETITTPGGTGEILIHQYSSNSLEIDANLVTSGGLTKTGPGTLILGGFNSGLTGPINLNQAQLVVTRAAAVNSASSINMNDNSNMSSPVLAFQFGNGVSDTVTTNIHIGVSPVGAASFFPAAFNTGSSLNSTVTLSGTISSAPGLVVSAIFGNGQDITSTINLTGHNTFLGNVFFEGGSLGINSNASLGDPSNTLYLFEANAAAGGLVFLNGGINLTRPVVVTSVFPTRIVCNGADFNFISGVISDFLPALFPGGRLYKAGSGTVVLSQTNTYSGGTQIDGGTLAVTADANLGAAGTPVAINSQATLAIFSGFATSRPLIIGPTSAGGIILPANLSVSTNETFTPHGGISDSPNGAGILGLTGTGTVLLNSPNSYTGGTVVQKGTLQVMVDSALGGGDVTVNALGTLTYTASDTTRRTFTLNSGALSVAAGQTLTLNGASVGGGFLRGPGTFAITGGSFLSGVSTINSTVINQTGPAYFNLFSNGGSLTVATGQSATISGFTNQGSGIFTVGAGGAVNASDFQTYGVLTLSPGSTAVPTMLTNGGASPLYLNGGSRTFISIPSHAGQFDAGIDLAGQNAVIAGGLLINNGYVVDSVGAGTKAVIADFGSLVKGAGFYQNSVQTVNGGKFQSGNSPGRASFGSFTFGPGGVSNYVFAIDDATGTAGPSPDANGQVSGWGLVKSIQRLVGGTTTTGDFAWTATPTNKLTVSLDTLVNPTTVGTDVAGPMADFDPTKPYAWPAATWAGNYSGPTDPAALDASTVFDTSGFVNPVGGTFGWSLDAADRTLSLTYSPSAVPEPGTLLLTGLAGLGCWLRRRRFSSFVFDSPSPGG